MNYLSVKELYDKMYITSYYQGIYSSLKDKILANGSHSECSSKDEET